MAIYCWSSRFMSSYYNGFIIAEADNIEEARARAIKAFEAHSKEYDSWNVPNEELRREFETDISEEPNNLPRYAGCHIHDGVVLVDGND